jgi:excisionase family DNA binding protein
MAQKYYNSKETAKLLGVSDDEVKQMLDRRELHGYRDGADWKFKADDIDEMVKQRGKAKEAPAADVGGDVLLSEVELGQSDTGTSGTVIAPSWGEKAPADSDIQLADSDLTLARDSGAPITAKKDDVAAKVAKFEELDLAADEDLALKDSSVGLPAKPAAAGPGQSDIDLGAGKSDDDLVLGDSKPSSDVTLGGDSGISLIDPSDSGLSLEEPMLAGAGEESLELGEEDMSGTGEGSDMMAPVKVKPDDDFLLTPLEEATDSDSSGSGSQVIALDTEGEQAATMLGMSSGVGGTMAAMLEEDLAAQPIGDMGAMGQMGPLGPALVAQPEALIAGGPAIQPLEAAYPEAPYTGLQVGLLAACAVLLMLCGMMVYDLARNTWSWESPYAVSSGLMDAVLSLVESK